MELTLLSKHSRPLKPLVEAALANEVRLLEAGIRQTSARLFEADYGMSKDEFVRRLESDELAEQLEFVDWLGEYRLLQRLQKADMLREIEFAN